MTRRPSTRANDLTNDSGDVDTRDTVAKVARTPHSSDFSPLRAAPVSLPARPAPRAFLCVFFSLSHLTEFRPHTVHRTRPRELDGIACCQSLTERLSGFLQPQIPARLLGLLSLQKPRRNLRRRGFWLLFISDSPVYCIDFLAVYLSAWGGDAILFQLQPGRRSAVLSRSTGRSAVGAYRGSRANRGGSERIAPWPGDLRSSGVSIMHHRAMCGQTPHGSSDIYS